MTAAAPPLWAIRWHNRKTNVESTLNRLLKGKPATGTPRLASLLGDEVISKLLDGSTCRKGQSAAFTRWQYLGLPHPDRTRFTVWPVNSFLLIEPHSEADPVALLSTLSRVRQRHWQRPIFSSRGRKQTSYELIHGVSWSNVEEPAKAQHCRRSSGCCATRTPIGQQLSCYRVSLGEGIIWAVRDAIFSKDGEKCWDVGGQDKRLLAVEPEFAQQLKLMAGESNILSTVLRQAWDNGNLERFTKNNPAQATGAHISIIGHITQQELRRYLNETELGNGFW